MSFLLKPVRRQGSRRASVSQSFMSQRRKEFIERQCDRWEVIYLNRMLVRFTSMQANVALPWVLSGLHFYNERKRRGRRSLFFLTKLHVWTPVPTWVGQGSLFVPPHMVKPRLSQRFGNIFLGFSILVTFILRTHLPINDFVCVCVCADPVLEVINLIALDRL